MAMVLLGLAGCGPAAVPTGINDPQEAHNREIHAFNKAVDRSVLRPLAEGGAGSLPEPVKDGIVNVAANLAVPGDVVNTLLQGRPGPALENSARFVLNTTLGIGGLFDPATALGLPGRPTDFGETLHVWGAPEGSYLEVPFLGPTTDRDLLGTVVDAGLNPWRFVLPVPERNAVAALRLSGRIVDRSRYSETVSSILYDSADSYAQARLLYLQNRRFELGQATDGGTSGTGSPDETFIDPYEDPYGN